MEVVRFTMVVTWCFLGVQGCKEVMEVVGWLLGGDKEASKVVDHGGVRVDAWFELVLKRLNEISLEIGGKMPNLNVVLNQLTPPYTSQHNGVFERRNRTLLDMVRSMMNLTTLSLSFWDYALESATRILNMVPTKKRDTPYKLQQRSVKCIFIGYPKETMGYYFYFPPENKIVVARYAEFFEKNLITQEVSGRAIDLEEIQDEDTSPSKITSKIPMEVEGFEPPQEEEILICRFESHVDVSN
ncbi:retrotransposon protein, putative, ty1-copia subclass [Tanacetum coccineum]